MKLDIEKVLVEYGLKAGDKLVIGKGEGKNIYKIVLDDYTKKYYLLGDNYSIGITLLFEVDFEKVGETVGNLICKAMNCEKCPLQSLSCDSCLISKDLYAALDYTLNKYPELEPLRKSFMKKLDEEVKK